MFFNKNKADYNNTNGEEALKIRLLSVLKELEELQVVAEERLKYLQDNLEGRIDELEMKILEIEGRLLIINQVISSLDPQKRVN